MSTTSPAVTHFSILARTSRRSPSKLSYSLCTQCRSIVHANHRPPLPSLSNTQAFSTHHPLRKKQGGKGSSKNTVGINASKIANDNIDPLDFSTLESEITKIVEKLQEDVRGIRAGGIDIEAVENARVTLKNMSTDAAKKKMETKEVVKVKLRDLCQVVPRGRMLVLMVGDKEHLKPLHSAVSSPPLNLSPLPSSPQSSSSASSHQSLEIHIPIPPTTTESRLAALANVPKRGESALFDLRQARGAQKKTLRQLQLARKVGPDRLNKAEKELEKVNERGVGRVKKVVEEKRKALGEG
ncbi:MAG: hypothetical protein Q9182_003182 [Xanthomendoza sp. 2 TL-2023]